MSISSDRILYQDDHLLAVAKRSGELVVKGAGRTDKLPLFDYLKRSEPQLCVLHRLDFETSGVILFAKSKQVEKAVLDSNFADWQKVYHTLVMGRLNRPKGTIRKPLAARGKGGPAPAVTHYHVLEKFRNSSYLEVEIETGRRHQIRQHLAHIRHPLVLDPLYGHKKFDQVFRQEFGYRKFFLHAIRLALPHPVTGEELMIESPLPKQFQAIIKQLQSLH